MALVEKAELGRFGCSSGWPTDSKWLSYCVGTLATSKNTVQDGYGAGYTIGGEAAGSQPELHGSS